MSPWINHPRSGKPDTMLTAAVVSTVVCLFKFLMSGVTLEVLGYNLSFGTVDASTITAVLTPTLLSYVARKYTDSPGKESKE